MERLHSEGKRAFAGQIERHGWQSLLAPEESSQRFWAVAIGVVSEGLAMGRSPDDMSTALLRAIGEQATESSVMGGGGRLRLVGKQDVKNSTDKGARS
jgi:hypothetical protein